MSSTIFLMKNSLRCEIPRTRLVQGSYNVLRKVLQALRRINKSQKQWIKNELDILWQISEGFYALRFSCFHEEKHQWKIGYLGLLQPAAKNTSSNDKIYGELTTGYKPFAYVEHDIHLILKILDGERSVITEDTPECYADLMKSCWDPNAKKRPSINKS
ncbi:hypothetical protein C1645_823080 [Glomus cerebriforme]|uniref:Serine-threonine/tyrosine-protein kinase catalytic domain-containing protein n=1 Tax=Glomus cerebriforme TaxID=658196 RepID=A0A397T6I4_9GLOM|nr:hypothetical protein C1645_823080 [Glomus cerebriforme]